MLTKLLLRRKFLGWWKYKYKCTITEDSEVKSEMSEVIYYGAYGSNLLRERFLVYIKGGVYEGKVYEGCRDKTEPVAMGWMYVPYRLYFAKCSPRWENKGIAFLSCKKETNLEFYSVIRLWKITEEQFYDIQKQEGKSWYNYILELGEKDGVKIKTITGCWTNEIQSPSEKYLKIIKKGLKETTNWDDEKIRTYLMKFL
ncbi:hypothetical protein [Thermoanaerobacter kivui]